METTSLYHKWSKTLLGMVVVISAAVLVGWAFDIETLKRLLPNAVAMNPVTALSFIFSAISCWLLTMNIVSKKAHNISYILAWLIVLIGAGKLLSIVFGFDFRFDKLLFSNKLGNEMAHQPFNQMAPNTAFCFLLTGACLVLLRFGSNKKVTLSQNIAMLIALAAIVSLIGYLYNSQSFYTLLSFIPMAIMTAFNFLLLSLAILFAYPDKGLVVNFTSSHAGSVAARMLLPVALMTPILLGYLQIEAIKTALISKESATTILIVAIFIVLFLYIYYSAYLLNKNDIKQKAIGEELAKSEKRFRNLFQNTPYPMWVYDLDTLQFLEANNTAIVNYGYSHKEFLNMRITDIRPESDVPLLLQNISERKSEIDNSGDWKHQLKNGKLIDVEITSHLLEFNGRKASLVIANDITERKKNEEQIKALNKELEAFSFSVAHDLRAPLRIIDGYAAILQEDYESQLDKEGKRYLNVISSNAQQMGRLIDDLLNLSRIGRAYLNFSNVNMEALVESVIDELIVLADKTRMDFILHKMEPTRCDNQLMKHVFTNLISNAIKYSQYTQKSVIEIGSYKNQVETVYYIKDNGVGFDMKYVDKLFGVFQRLHKPAEFEGTGVGLAIVQRIIFKHGGRVWAESVQTQGATFYFSIPHTFNNNNNH